MGSICPNPWVTIHLKEQIKKEIIEPTFNGLKKDGLIYKGILYFGLMITDKGPKNLECPFRGSGNPGSSPHNKD